MKFVNSKSLAAVFGASVLTAAAFLPQARGELVYEGDIPAVEERDATRQALSASEKARATVQQRQTVSEPSVVMTAPAPQAVIVQSAPVATTEMTASAGLTPSPEVQNLSKSELMRRERVREELKNEDILQERLEELRLRDERRRTEQLVSGQPVDSATAPVPVLLGAPSTAGTASAALPAPLKEEQVVAPVTERPAAGAAMVTSQTLVEADEPAISHSAAVSTAVFDANANERTLIYIQPRAGVSDVNSSYYDIRPHFSAGLSLGVSVSENVSFEAGYTFSEYGIALAATHPFAMGYQAAANKYGYLTGFTGNGEGYTLKQNVGELGLKLHFLGPDARLRPFIGGGGAYSRSFVNYDQQTINALARMGQANPARDYDLSSFLGYLSTGFDVRVNKSIAVTAGFKYYSVLSSTQNSTLNNMALYNPMYYGAGYTPYAYYNGLADEDKQQVGGSMADASFYTVTAGVTFTF